jgi:hypothetical protein
MRPWAADRENGFLHPAERAVGQVEDFDLPAAALAEPGVHPEEIRREQRGLVPAGAGADFDDGIAVVQGIGGREELGELRLQRGDLGLEAIDIGAGQFGQLGVPVGEHVARLGQLGLDTAQPVAGDADRLEAGVFAAELLSLFGIPGDVRAGQEPAHLLRPRERLRQRLTETVLHRLARGLARPVLLAEPLHPARGVDELLLAGEVRVAFPADFDVDRVRRRARHKGIAARAGDHGALVGRMDAGFHSATSLPKSSEE